MCKLVERLDTITEGQLVWAIKKEVREISDLFSPMKASPGKQKVQKRPRSTPPKKNTVGKPWKAILNKRPRLAPSEPLLTGLLDKKPKNTSFREESEAYDEEDSDVEMVTRHAYES